MDKKGQNVIKREADPALLESIGQLLLQKGPKATTMDFVAKTLSISKRTLYEIFDNKDEMILAALKHKNDKRAEECRAIYDRSENVMVALYSIFDRQCEDLKDVSPNFFRDLDNNVRNLREGFKEQEKSHDREVMKVFRLGVRQGVFRNDVNYPILLKIFNVQMESLKRMEEVYSNEFTLQEVLSSIVIGFLRSIASPKGMKELDRLVEETENNKQLKYRITK